MHTVSKLAKLFSKVVLGCLLCTTFATIADPVSAASSISVSAPASIDLEVIPTADGASNYGVANLSVNTTNSSGYRILINGSGTSALTNNFHPESITSITTPTTLSDFPINYWGIYLGGSTPSASTLFQPLSTTPTEFAQNDLANASGTYQLAIATNADTSLPAGVYSNQIVISVVANPEEIETRSMADITSLQDISPSICSNSNLETTYTLTDKRDGKSYKVAKLKDGNCWMQEDLKLSLSTNKALTPEDSDVRENWKANSATGTVAIINSETNGQRSWAINGVWFYQFNAATAGTGQKVSTDNVQAESSICPKGWGLAPASANTEPYENGSYHKLMQAYGLPINASDDSAIRGTPFYYKRNGYIGGPSDEQPAFIGDYGDYWTKGSYSETWARSLNFSSYQGLHVGAATDRSFGFNVRCVALGITE